jgi:putative membrane protein
MMGHFGSYGYWGTEYGWPELLLNLGINLVFLIGIVLLIAWFVRRVFPTSNMSAGRGGSVSTAKEILQARYARGEITRDQYQLMLSDLS